MPIKVSITSTRSGPSLSDSVSFPIECPNCHHKTTRRLAELKNDPVLVCSCGHKFKVESGGTAKKAADQVKELDRLLDNLFKR